MPFKSEAQRRKFYAMADRGEMPRSKVEEYERATKGEIPERVTGNRGSRSEGYKERKNMGQDAERREMKKKAKSKARKKLMRSKSQGEEQQVRNGAPVSTSASKA